MTEVNQPNNQPQMQVKISDETLKGVYANMVQVGHTPEEFVLDFMNLFPPTGVVSARVLMSPSHIKRFVSALSENIKRYEEQFGEIKVADQPQQKIGFRTE
jgi:hypothetical protein